MHENILSETISKTLSTAFLSLSLAVTSCPPAPHSFQSFPAVGNSFSLFLLFQMQCTVGLYRDKYICKPEILQTTKTNYQIALSLRKRHLKARQVYS